MNVWYRGCAFLLWLLIMVLTGHVIIGDLPLAPPRAEAAESRQRESFEVVIQKLRMAIQYEVEQKDLPAFSMALVDGDQVVWAEGFGFQDPQRTVPASADTVYRVGSISKLFTDIAVMQLVEAGTLDLDAPVQDYLPEFQPHDPHGRPITLRQLLSHRSGLVRESPVGNYFDPSEPTLDATIASLNDTSLVYAPETRTKYSNAAIAVVGGLVEKVAGRSHPEFVKDNILARLGMERSSFERTPAVDQHLTTGWMWSYEGRRYQAPEFLLGTGPAGNMVSSVRDLGRFAISLLAETRTDDGRLLQPETWRRMITPEDDADGRPQAFGLGFHIGELDGMTKIGHGGAVYGFSTQLAVLPEKNFGVVAASSLDVSNGVVTRLADYALRLLVSHRAGDDLPGYQQTEPLPAERAGQLLGRFQEWDGESAVEITEFDGKTFLRRGAYRHELRATVDSGAIVTDDVLGFGVEVAMEDGETVTVNGTRFRRLPDQPPAEIPDRWTGLLGEYGWDHNILYILEDQGKLYALIEWIFYYPLEEVGEDEYAFPDHGLYHGERLKFTRDPAGRATEVVAASVRFARREVGTVDGATFQIEPLRPVDELRVAAREAAPPVETGEYREADLIEPSRLDPTIRLDIRYASTNNFMGAKFYDQPRAFLQRPAAEALVRVQRRLGERGLGLLIHDAYRPWYVTKMFWDATPEDLRQFVANPAHGSRHNRGCAVDLTLYDLASGEPLEMVAGYDEFSGRSHALYPGGTSRQRWHRDVLRRVMEAEGFRIYEPEWWHFDYRDWQHYRIGNVTFEDLDGM
jgi:CubicO group peptidase (beta-lactamase class C family)/D-alanyl-D-alanine dipeptidase